MILNTCQGKRIKSDLKTACAH